MKLAYIAGPFRAANAWQRAQNIREAEQVGMDVAEHLGVQPVIPHSNTGNFDGTLDDAFWLEGTLKMMRRCDLVVCTERWTQSKGAQAEVAEALRLNMPVYIYADGEYRTHVPGQPWKVLQPWELRAIVEADWKREITIDPSTNSISATPAACSAPVPEIIRVHPSGAGDHGSIDVTTGAGLTRYAVQQGLGKSLRDVTVDELAKLGLKPSQPEPPPTGNGDLVTPPLLEALADYPELTVLVSARDAFGRAKYGTGLRTHNGRDPLEDARQELGDLLQYLWQAKMEGSDLRVLLKMCEKGVSVIKEQCEPFAAIAPALPTLHPRPFWWDFDDGRFVAVDGGHNYLGIETVDDLLERAPNALDGRESKYPRDAHELPSFGFRLEHTGPRTLREYLEAP